MSNALIRWLGNALAPSDRNSKSLKGDRKSFTLIPFPSIIEVPRAKTAPSPTPDDPDIFEQTCVCAVHDSYFITRYVKQPHGRYRATTTVKLDGGRESGRGKSPALQTLSMDKIEGPHPPCPWCSCNMNMRYHCYCDGVVCGGRVEGTLFKCRDSCGKQWYPTGNVTEIKGIPPSPERKDYRPSGGATPRPSAPASQSRPVTPNRLLLGPGSNVPARTAPGSVNRFGGRS
jgi:hypothetical protein